MSGAPHPTGVAEAVSLAQRISELRQDLSRVTSEMDRLMKEKAALSERLGMADRRFREVMAEMDVDTTGNFGWAARMYDFVTEVVRQARAGAPESKKEER